MRGKTIADYQAGKENNFDIIRLIAALLVLLSHSFPLSGTPNALTAYLLGHNVPFLGVSIFFIISGFLVMGSIQRRSLKDYFISRALRIYPALALVVLLSAFALGPLFTSLSLADYLAHPATYSYLLNATGVTNRFDLPGVFTANPFVGSVNGSLWTIPLEMACYVMLAVLYAFGFVRPVHALIVTAALAAALVAAHWFGLSIANRGFTVFTIVQIYPLLRYGLMFAIGCAFWMFRDRTVLDGRIAAVLLVVFAAAGSIEPYHVLLTYLSLPYLLLFAAYRRPLGQGLMRRIGDLSYGTYVFAFPIQQMTVAIVGAQIGGWTLSLIVVPIVLLVAWLSWRLIEQPALRWRDRISLHANKATPAAVSAAPLSSG